MIKIVSVGDPNCRDFSKYLKRMAYFQTTQVTQKNYKEKDYIKQAKESDYLVLLDPRGEQMTSEVFSDFLNNKYENHKRICFCIGPSDGIAAELYDEPHYKLSLGKMTWPHEIARVLLIEQIYRAQQIVLKHPYHK